MTSQERMRLIALAVAAMLTCAPAYAQQPPASSTPAATSSGQDDPAKLNLPVSVDRIKDALAQPPAQPLKGVDSIDTKAEAHFRVEVQERQRFEELVKSLKFDSGPPVPGGLYGYDQQQRLFNPVDNPRVQPYAAFTQTELVQVALTSFLERYFAGRVIGSLTAAERARAEAEARQEVQQALADFWASQLPNAAATTDPKQ